MTKQSHDPAADQHFEFPVDGSAAANHMHPGLIGTEKFFSAFDQEVERRQIEQTLAQDATKTPVAHYAVGENGEFEALPVPPRNWTVKVAEELADDPIFTRFDNPFALALEQAVADTDLEDTDGRSAREIAGELLGHSALAGYWQHDHEVYNTGEGAQEQFERYAETDAQLCDLADGMPEHRGVDMAEGANTLALEQEWLGNLPELPDGEQLTKDQAREQWNQHRRPQLMAIARAGLDALQELSGMQAEIKGFHEDRPVEDGPALQHWQGNKLMLIVSEAVEAHDEIRGGHPAYETYYPTFTEVSNEKQVHKPEGVPSEIADVIVRSADFAWTEGFDLSQIVLEKLEYNNTRPHKHGKGF